MQETSRYRLSTFILEFAAILLALIFLSPFYLVLTNSVKGLREILVDAASFPQVYKWSNYADVWNISTFRKPFGTLYKSPY